MVLSNKKLKLKLRAALSESTTTKPDSINPNIDSSLIISHPQDGNNSSFNNLVQKPRLSKREKRRQSQPPAANEEEEISGKHNSESNPESGDGQKKRNRNEEEEEQQQSVKKEAQAKKKLKKTPKKKKKKKNNKIYAEKVIISQEIEVPDPEKNKDAESQVQDEFPTKIYVGGIPYYSTEEDIRSFFQGCGTITEVDCMSFPDSGKFRGIAIISFKTEGAAKRALALDGSEMGGLSLKIQTYKTKKSADFAPKLVEGYNRIYTGNLSWDITEDDLKKFFLGCNISSIKWGSDKETGEFKGYAHIDFADSVSLTMALKLDQRVVCGRPIKISCAVALKGGAKTNSKVRTTTPCLKSMPIIEAENVKDAKAENSSENANLVENSSKNARDVVIISNDGVGAGQMRRRTCYECGGKGHISSDCPKKQTVGPTIGDTIIEAEKVKDAILAEISSKNAIFVGNSSKYANLAENSSKNASDVVITSKDGGSAGKMRRRTCYEGGGKGHISLDCPKKQTVGPSIGDAS